MAFRPGSCLKLACGGALGLLLGVGVNAAAFAQAGGPPAAPVRPALASIAPGTASVVPGALSGAAGTVSAATSAPAGAPGLVFVLNSRDASVSKVDRGRLGEVGRLNVGKEPHHLYPTPDGRSLIVASAMSNELHFLDPLTGELQRRIAGIDDPYQIGFSPDNRWFVTAALRLDRVDLYRYDGSSLTLSQRVPLPKAPSHLWFSADSRFVFVTLQESNEIAAIDLVQQTLAWKMPTGAQPAGLIMTPDDKYLLVGVMGENYVQVIDWRRRETVARIVTGKGAHNFRGLGDKRHVFVSNRAENTVSLIDMQTMTVAGSFAVPGGPDCLEVSADRRQLWVTARWAKQVAVVDLETRRVVRTIPVGRSPHGLYFHDRAPTL
ncbi:MAG: YncE family protein [Burkholderiaceae bacterium]